MAPLIRNLGTTEGSVHAPAEITPGKNPRTLWPLGCVGPRADLDIREKRKISCSSWDSNLGSSSPQPSRYKAIPLQVWTGLRVPGGWGSQISRQSAHGGSKVVSPTHRPLISVTGWVDLRATVRTEGLCQWNFPMTPSGIEPATFRLVQCLKQLRHSVTQGNEVKLLICLMMLL
jgi:hypothetical protein